jgi:hypothetical protein
MVEEIVLPSNSSLLAAWHSIVISTHPAAGLEQQFLAVPFPGLKVIQEMHCCMLAAMKNTLICDTISI